MGQYKYDIAISLCKQDVDFARKLIKSLNSGLKVFFYEDRQEELVSKIGPEAFTKVFKDEARIVVILSRNEWGNSFYTEIENGAILERISKKGYSFLLVIPMAPGQIPSWYHSIRIYADPRNFPVDQLAKFIEFKVTEEGGIVKPVTLEDRYQNLLSRIEEKKNIIQLQTSKEAIESGEKELYRIRELFNQKILLLKNNILGQTLTFNFTEHSFTAHFGINDLLLECKIHKPDELYHRIVTTQDFSISFHLFRHYDMGKERKLLSGEQLLFYYTPLLKGWAKPYLQDQPGEKELLVLFSNRNNSKYYDLKDITDSDVLIEKWFQVLLKQSSTSLERYL